MKTDKHWQRDIWYETAYWDHKIDRNKFEHYSSIPYSDERNDEMRILWLSSPKGKKDLPVIVWFHGGGFTGDHHECPKELYDSERFVIVETRYRLSPSSKAPDYHEDGAMALAWVLKNIKEFGGDPQKVFVGGMSAGAYLALIVTMDKDWLKPYGFSYKDLAGIISISGQTSTHFYVAKELKLGKKSKYAPLEHLSKDLPPMLIIVGDASCDVKGRAEENVRMATRLHAMGHENVECHSLGGKDHSGAFISGSPLVIPFINRVLEKEEK